MATGLVFSNAQVRSPHPRTTSGLLFPVAPERNPHTHAQHRMVQLPMLSLLLLLLLAFVTIPTSSHAFFSHTLKAAKTRLRSRGLVLAGGQPFKAEEGLVPDFCLAVLGDLHLDRNDMALHNEGRQHIMDNMAKLKSKLSSPKSQARLVSLGDLGAYGDAGTTTCFEHAKAYLEGYHLPFNLVTG